MSIRIKEQNILWSWLWVLLTAAAAKSLQSCPTLCDPIDGSPPGSPVLGILQARTLEWVAISFSNAWKWKVKLKGKSLSPVWLFATPWTATYWAPPSMGFSRQEYWSGAPLPSPSPVLGSYKPKRNSFQQIIFENRYVEISACRFTVLLILLYLTSSQKESNLKWR